MSEQYMDKEVNYITINPNDFANHIFNDKFKDITKKFIDVALDLSKRLGSSDVSAQEFCWILNAENIALELAKDMFHLGCEEKDIMTLIAQFYENGGCFLNVIKFLFKDAMKMIDKQNRNIESLQYALKMMESKGNDSKR